MTVSARLVPQPAPAVPWLDRRLLPGVTPARLILLALLLVSAGLHFTHLDAIGDANRYYTAAVNAMLQSWDNFFFVAAEPGGSVSVDKPPLGLWVEAAFAAVFGVNGVAVSLPNMLAGLACIPLMYALVKRWYGPGAGLAAAAVLAFTPILLATDRNNTMDSQLLFVLLLAAWAFIKATETGQSRYVYLGALLVGLGFNIKMLQAFLPLPAFYALYFFGAARKWWHKGLHLGAATGLLLVVSLAWPIAVDLTPADQRPYVGSSTDNTVMELIIGHNGLNRLVGGLRGNRAAGPDAGPPQGPPPPGQPPNNPQLTTPRGGDVPPNRPQTGGPANGPANPQAAGVPFSFETGVPGVERLFVAPLGKEASWLLPFGLLGLVAAVFAARPAWPVTSPAQRGLLLWGGWLVTCLAFFSMAELFHAYYMIMLAPPLAAAVALGLYQLWRLSAVRPLLAGLVLGLGALATLGFQIWLAGQYGLTSLWLLTPLAVFGLAMLVGALAALHVFKGRGGWAAFFALTLASLLLLPGYWTVKTVVSDSANINLPAAYGGENSGPGGRFANPGVDEDLLAYLEANTTNTRYLVAVTSAQVGAPFVLATSRPVLYMGGFSGGDPVVDAADIAALVADGELRFVYYDGEGRGYRRNGVDEWLEAHCAIVPPFRADRGGVLYDCAAAP